LRFDRKACIVPTNATLIDKLISDGFTATRTADFVPVNMSARPEAAAGSV
jgi:hypothetical protein